MTALSYSQNTYPKKIVWNNDTIIAITPNQLTQINIEFERLSYCREDLKASKEYIGELEQLNTKKDSLISEYQLSLRGLNKLYVNLDSLAIEIDNQNKKLHIQNTKLRRNIKLFSSVSFVTGASLILILR